MPSIKVYSPPIITAKGNIKLGHGANLVWCDVIGRIFSDQGYSINYNYPSWNHQGKMFDNLAYAQDSEGTLQRIESSLLEKISLFGLKESTPYRDTNSESRRNAQERFNALLQKGFIHLENEEYFLRIDRIRDQTGLISHIETANFFPEGGRGRALDLIKTLDKSYPITKPREFATPIPGDEQSIQKINPIFDLAVSPFLSSQEPVDYSIDGLKTMLRGTFIPFVICAGLFDMPFCRNVALHGYLLTDPQSHESNVAELYRKTNSDVLRGSALLCTRSMEDIQVNQTGIKKIIKGTSKLVKLAWFFKDLGLPERIDHPVSSSIERNVRKMRHALAMDELMQRTHSLSGRLERGDLTLNDRSEYLSLLNDSRPFFPSTAEKAIDVLAKKFSAT